LTTQSGRAKVPVGSLIASPIRFSPGSTANTFMDPSLKVLD